AELHSDLSSRVRLLDSLAIWQLGFGTQWQRPFSTAPIKFSPDLHRITSVTGSADLSWKRQLHCRSSFISQFFGSPGDGIKNLPPLGLIFRCSPESVLAPEPSSSFCCSSAAAHFRPSLQF